MIESGVAPRTLLGESSSDIVSNLGSGYCAMQNAGMWGVSALAAGSPDLEYGAFRLPVPDDGERSEERSCREGVSGSAGGEGGTKWWEGTEYESRGRARE